MMNKMPAYLRVYNALRMRITEKEYAIGDLLPPEPELERQFSVSRTTVRRAVEILSREGLVEAKQGRGTVVLDSVATQNINFVSSVSKTLERKGHRVETKNMHIDVVAASARVAGELGIPQGTPVVRIQRLQLADDKPIAIFKNYLIREKVPGIEAYAGNFSHLYDFLEATYGIVIDEARDRISARSATFEEAEMLKAPIGAALIYLVRICYSDGKAFETDHCKILGDKYEFEVLMKGRS